MEQVLLLTAHPHLYTCQSLCQAARRLRVQLWPVTPPLWWQATPSKLDLPEACDANSALLLTRAGTFSLTRILRHHRRLQLLGTRPLQTRQALLDACDQWRTLRRLAAAGLRVPRSVIVRQPSQFMAALQQVPGSSWFVKARRGSKGSHVFLAETPSDAARLVHFLWGEGMSSVLQEDLRSQGPVERHLVCGNRVLATAHSTPAPGEFRSNWHRGGRFHAVPTEGASAALAAAATAVMGLPYAGVDLIAGETPTVLEVNASPGLQGLVNATSRDLATEILQTLLQHRQNPATQAADEGLFVCAS
jgi:ribosomal protein S6--L-glutamate ligase